MIEAAAIVAKLSAEERAALLAMPTGWVHWRDIPDEVADTFMAPNGDPYDFLADSEGTAHVMWTPIAEAVRSELQKRSQA